MNPEIETTIDIALRQVAERLSEESLERLSYHTDIATRDALLDAIQGLGPDAMFELALEAAAGRLREQIADERGPRSFIESNPLHPNYRRGR